MVEIPRGIIPGAAGGDSATFDGRIFGIFWGEQGDGVFRGGVEGTAAGTGLELGTGELERLVDICPAVVGVKAATGIRTRCGLLKAQV